MAIPLIVANFDGDLDAVTREGVITLPTVPPVRYAPGPNGKKAAINYSNNPNCNAHSNWFSELAAGVSGARDTSVRHRGSASYRVTCDGVSASIQGMYHATSSGSSGPAKRGMLWSGGAWVKAPAGWQMRALLREGGSGAFSSIIFMATGEWQFVHLSRVLQDPTSTQVHLRIDNSGPNSSTPYTMWVTDVLLVPWLITGPEDGPIDGDRGPGFGWLGAQYSSPSYREAWAHGGAFILESTSTNLFHNPLLGVSISGWYEWQSTGSDVIATRANDRPDIAPWTWRNEVSVKGGPTHTFMSYFYTNGMPNAGPFIGSFDCAASKDMPWARTVLRIGYTDGTSEDSAILNTPIGPVPQRIVTPVMNPNPAKTVDYVMPFITYGNTELAIGDVVWMGRGQVEQRDTATSPIPEFDRSGTIIPGFTWSGTAHASSSSRPVAYINIHNGLSPVGRITPKQGCMILRTRWRGGGAFSRYHVQLGRLQAGEFGLPWYTTNDRYAAYLRHPDGTQEAFPSGGPTIGDFDTVRLEWGDGYLLQQVNDGPKFTSQRTKVVPDGSEFPNVWQIPQSSQPNHEDVAGFMAFDRPLTDAEWEEIRTAPRWEWGQAIPKLGGVVMADIDGGGGIGGEDAPILVGGIIMGEDH